MRTDETSYELTAGDLRVTVTASGECRIGRGAEPDWLGPGRPIGTGADAEPASRSVSTAGCEVETRRMRTSFVAVPDRAAVIVRMTARERWAAPDDAAFDRPVLGWRFDPGARSAGGAPGGLRGFGFQYTEFALPVFSDAALSRWRLLPFRPAVVFPLGLVADDGRTLLVAPLENVHEQVLAVPAGRDDAGAGLRLGWHGELDGVDPGWSTSTVVIAGDGPRECLETWGAMLRERSGVVGASRDRDALGTRLSYWTDNGSAYWYRTEPGHDPASGIVAAVDDLEARGLPVHAVQLDSWWYPHAVLRPFDTEEWEVPPTGMVRWEPRDDVLPDGITALRERLGRRPLVAHCRHLSSSSPYVDEFPCWVDGERAHPRGIEMYERLLDQCVAWGVQVFEHDWLIECYLGVRELRATPGAAATWQRGIDDALEVRGLTAQWCMASPADFAGATALRNVTSVRTSGDQGYLVPPHVLWAWFLHTNQMARALGLWPYKDVFRTATDHPEREVEALLSALSAGPVGVGDALGTADVDLIRRTCRADGVLVRPDVPVAATDAAPFAPPVWGGGLLVASTRTAHTAGRWGYVAVLNVAMEPARLARVVDGDDLGADGPEAERVVVWDWRARSVRSHATRVSYEVALDQAEWDYCVLAPVLSGGIAVVGDPALYATAGDARVADVVVGVDHIGVTVLGAHERVELVGWSEREIVARGWTPAGGEVDLDVQRDGATGAWSLHVDVPDAGWVNVTLRNA